MLCALSISQGLKEVDSLSASDHMDDGTEIVVKVTIDRRNGLGGAVFDFTGTGPQVYGNINAPRAVTYSAIIYTLRCLVQKDIPLNQGCMAPVEV
jgi:5-oxoprolinase (ATP-hydrolysing)